MEDYPAGHGKALLQDSSVSDPLSLGIACLLRGMWEGDSGEDGKVGWREMVKLGFEWVEEYAPRVSEENLSSHRTALSRGFSSVHGADDYQRGKMVVYHIVQPSCHTGSSQRHSPS